MDGDIKPGYEFLYPLEAAVFANYYRHRPDQYRNLFKKPWYKRIFDRYDAEWMLWDKLYGGAAPPNPLDEDFPRMYAVITTAVAVGSINIPEATYVTQEVDLP